MRCTLSSLARLWSDPSHRSTRSFRAHPSRRRRPSIEGLEARWVLTCAINDFLGVVTVACNDSQDSNVVTVDYQNYGQGIGVTTITATGSPPYSFLNLGHSQININEFPAGAFLVPRPSSIPPPCRSRSQGRLIKTW